VTPHHNWEKNSCAGHGRVNGDYGSEGVGNPRGGERDTGLHSQKNRPVNLSFRTEIRGGNTLNKKEKKVTRSEKNLRSRGPKTQDGLQDHHD